MKKEILEIDLGESSKKVCSDNVSKDELAKVISTVLEGLYSKAGNIENSTVILHTTLGTQENTYAIWINSDLHK